MAAIDTDPGFDTLAYAQTPKAADVEDKQAEAHAAAARASQSRLATKADLDNLEVRLRADISALGARLYGAMFIQTGVIAGIVVAIVEFLWRAPGGRHARGAAGGGLGRIVACGGRSVRLRGESARGAPC